MKKFKKYQVVDSSTCGSNDFQRFNNLKNQNIDELSIIYEGDRDETIISSQTYDQTHVKGKSPEIILVIVSYLLSIVCGMGCAFTSPTLLPMKEQDLLNDHSSPWYISFLSFGAIFGGPICGKVSNKYGRRTCIFVLLVLLCLKWHFTLLSEFVPTSSAFILLCIARFLFGIGFAFALITLPTYINECSNKQWRGLLSSSVGIGIGTGILIIYSIGIVLPWQYSALYSMIPLVVALPFILKLPESPRWLVLNGRVDDATKVLLWLRRSNHLAVDELNDILKSLPAKTEKETSGIAGLLKTLSTLKKVSILKPFLACLAIHSAQQFSMINCILSYSNEMLTEAGYNAASPIPLIVIGIMQLLSGIFCALLLDKFGRRPLVCTSSFLVVLSLISFGIYYQLSDLKVINSTSHRWLVLAIMGVYLISYNIGLSSIPWVMMAELLNPMVRDTLSSMLCVFNWSCSFLVTLMFSYMKRFQSTYFAMYFYAVISAILLVIIAVILPETKKKSLEEIQTNMNEKEQLL